VQIHAWITTKPEAMTRRVTVAVTDRGSWVQAHRIIDPDGRRGHGLAVMSGCTAEVHIQRSAGGTTVVLVSHDMPQHPGVTRSLGGLGSGDAR
jgi:anti-sigma regulatory factor (Ser/Thr protein kinase)